MDSDQLCTCTFSCSFSWIYFFCGFLAGPALNMKEYLLFMDGSLYCDAPNGRMPSPLRPFLHTVGSILIILVGVFLSMSAPVDFIVNSGQLTFLQRLAYLSYSVTLSRFPYYFAWKMSEGSAILMGLGYSSYDRVTGAKWDRACNCRPLCVEMAQNVKDITENWNIRTDRWLKHYVYERVKSFPVSMTFLISALWHGFYPGYYLAFMSGALMTIAAREIRRNIRPFFMIDEKTPKPSKIVYDFVCWFGTINSLNYCFSPFKLLSLKLSWNVWRSVYFCGHAIVILSYLLALSLSSIKEKKKKKN